MSESLAKKVIFEGLRQEISSTYSEATELRR